jgi:hypothetical protein
MYEYKQQLSNQGLWIRLIRIHPKHAESGILSSSMEFAQLDQKQKPEYYALSYTWGDESITTPILVDGAEFEVTVNLEVALSQMRDISVEKLWVDAICINQKDKEEKGSQIPKMGVIYLMAIGVIAWLGKEADDSSRALEILKSTAGQIILDPGYDLLQEHQEVAALLNRPYFQRVWIRQEISKAKYVFVMCGAQWMHWRTFADALRTTRKTERILWSIDLYSRSERHSKTDIKLFNALIWTRFALARNPLDKVYGLLGLCSDGDEIVRFPDYPE